MSELETSERERLSAQRMRDARWKALLTQRAAAVELGISATYLSHIERARRTPSLPLLSRMAARYSVGMAYLLGESGE